MISFPSVLYCLSISFLLYLSLEISSSSSDSILKSSFSSSLKSSSLYIVGLFKEQFFSISVKITLESNEDKECAEKRINDIFDSSGYLTIMDDSDYNGTIKFIAMMPSVLALSNFINNSEWNVSLSDDVIRNNYTDAITLLRKVHSKCTDIDKSKNCLSNLVSMMQDQAVLKHIHLDREPAYAKI